jgi:hypothetical protein
MCGHHAGSYVPNIAGHPPGTGAQEPAMTVTTTGLTRAAGIAAAAAGLIFVAVQVNHPTLDITTVATTEMAVRSTAKGIMTVLALAGITGMYLRQVRRIGVLGLVGWLLFSLGYLAMFGVEVVAGVVLPSLVDTAPGYVEDVLAAALGGTPTGDIGAMQALLTFSAIGYMGGGLLFGIALFRAGVLARWAAALLSVGTVSTLALSALPESFNRPLAVPVGVALIGLGVSLWRDQRSPARTSGPATGRVEHQAAR